MHPVTPDGRYFVVKGQLWRCTNPSLQEDLRQQLVNELMAARRDVKVAKAASDPQQLKAVRARVHAAKIALGERGPVWWTDGERDWNRCLVKNTPYAEWFVHLAEGGV